MTWELFARNEAGQRAAQIDEYEKAELIPRFNTLGSWAVDLPPTVGAQLLTPRWGVEFVRDGTIVLSGPTRQGKRTFDASKDLLTVSGVDDMFWLAARNAHPQPGSAAPAGTPPTYSSTEFDVRTDVASTVLWEYVDVNAGPGAIPARQVLALAADPVAGSTVTGRFRWENLLTQLQALAAAADPPLGFRVVDLTFEVYIPNDLTGTVVFSVELGNLAGFTYDLIAPTANFVVVGGGGDGTARAIVEVADVDAVTDWGRIETFRNGSSATAVPELSQAGYDELASKSAKQGVSITPIDGPGRAYLTDYTVGDQVSAVVNDVTVANIVREVRITLDGNGESVAPAVGSTVSQFSPIKVLPEVESLKKRVRALEAL